MSALIAHSESTHAMWDAFLRSRDLPDETSCSLVEFGDEAAMQDDLADLVLAGTKRATTSLLRWYGAGGERYPLEGDLFIVVDSRKRAFCVAEMTDVRTCAFRDVDDAYAYVEGEGDRSLSMWRAGHRAFFEAEASANGCTFDDDAQVVLQTFRVVWPREDGAPSLRP